MIIIITIITTVIKRTLVSNWQMSLIFNVFSKHRHKNTDRTSQSQNAVITPRFTTYKLNINSKNLTKS